MNKGPKLTKGEWVPIRGGAYKNFSSKGGRLFEGGTNSRHYGTAIVFSNRKFGSDSKITNLVGFMGTGKKVPSDSFSKYVLVANCKI